MKRIILFILTNLAIMLTLSVLASVFGVNQYLTSNGLNLGALLGFAAIFGFGGAFISLALSKVIAKWTMGLRVIQGNEGQTEAWLVNTISKFSQNVGIAMPEVAIYDSSEMNAFATGPTKNNSLVAVSTGLLNQMNKSEVEAVLGHEVAHIANGDMVTLTLLQGVLNTFVIFFARIVGYIASSAVKERGTVVASIVSFVFEIIFGLLASMIVATYSRKREFAADKGGANLAGKDSMINALARLGQQDTSNLSGSLQAFGISGKKNFLSLFSTHPPIEDRIEALRRN